jgi:hypothetical protein
MYQVSADHLFINAKAISEDEVNKLKKIEQHNRQTISSMVATKHQDYMFIVLNVSMPIFYFGISKEN